MLSTTSVGSSNFQDGVDGNVVGDPGIGPLRDNGGPTWTHRISRESIAIDAGSLVLALSSDQRGFEPRVVGADADMGALECGAVAVSVETDRLFSDGFDAYCD